MSSPQIKAPGNDPAKNDEVVQTQTNFTHQTGEVVSSSTMLKAETVAQPKFFQNVPHNDLGEFMQRLVEIYDGTLVAADTPLTTVSVGDPWALFLANAAVADKIAAFSLVRGVIEIVIIHATPGSCYGSYVWSALADGGAKDPIYDMANALRPHNCMQVDHFTRIDCAAAENVVMQLPWLWPYDYASLPSGPVGAWELNLTCLSPIRSGIDGGIAQGSYKIYARLMPGHELVVPHFQAGQRKGHLVPSTVTKAHAPALHKKLSVSKTADKVAGVADKLSGLPVIGPYAATASKVAHGIGKLAHAFGFSREQDEHHPTPFTTRSVTNVAHIDGADSSDVAALNTVCEISIDPTMAGSTPDDIMSNASLFNRWTLVSSNTWATSAASGADIASVYVSPFTAMTPNSQEVCMTTAGYIGSPFNFWRGDMEYLVVIPVSKFHRGSLQVYWVPFGSLAPSAVTNTTLNVVMDVASGEEHQFTVGYARDQPYLQKAYITPDVAIVPAGFANGQLRFRVVNPLVSQSETADVQILVFARAGANMDFAFPASTIAYSHLITGYVYSDISNAFTLAQGGALGDEDNHEEKPHVLVDSSGDYPGDELLWGETVSSVRALMQKPTKLRFKNTPGTTPRTIKMPVLGVPPGMPTPAAYVFLSDFSWANWYRVLFTGIACSERYKFFPRGPCMLGAAPMFSPISGAIATKVSTLAPMTFCGPNRGAEFTLPYYEPEKYLLGRRFYSTGVAPYQQRVNVWHISPVDAATTTPEVVLYHSYGPDIRVVGFRQVPAVYFPMLPADLTDDPFWYV